MRYDLSSKTPDETVKSRYGDFINLLLSGETISSAGVTVADDLAVVSNVQFSGSIVTFDISGGNDGDTICLHISANGSLGSIRHRKMYMRILSN